MMLKVLGVAAVAGMMRLLWPIEPLPAEEAPSALVQEVMSHRIVHMDVCNLNDLGLEGAECMVTKDSQGRFWMILFDDNMKMNMVVLYDGATHVLWCRADACT